MKKIYYLESSAALSWLLGENHSEMVDSLLRKADLVIVSILTILEVERTLSRLQAVRQIQFADRSRMKNTFSQHASSWLVRAIQPEMQDQLSVVFPLEPVRTLDAIHLVTALTFLEKFPDLKVISLDKRIIQNAQALGLPVAFMDLQ